MVKFSKFCFEGLHRDTDRRVVFKFREIWPTGNTWQKKQNFVWLSNCHYCADRAQNLPGPAPDNVYRGSRFHPNLFTFGGVVAERMNTAKTRRKVNPIFGWSLVSSRITRLQHYLEWLTLITLAYSTPGSIYYNVYICADVEQWLSAERYVDPPRLLPFVDDSIYLTDRVLTARRYARYMLSPCVRPYVCLSVCLSVTRRHCTKTAKRRITQTTTYDSPWTLVCWCQTYRRNNSNGITTNGGTK